MMKPAKQIEPPEWMQHDETVQVWSALNADMPSYGLMALFVGGCVRNTLMGKTVDDIDIATRHEPEQVIKLLERAGIKALPTGLDHGTVTGVVGEAKKTFEITTLRRDIKTDGRHADVSFSDSWLEDAERRDFTMNTLLADLSGNIYDPTNLGLKDLELGRVVFVGEPHTRIKEDYLRILRFFRFYAFYGQGSADDSALQACKAESGNLGELSKERITQEFLKIISVDRFVDILSIMFSYSVLSRIVDKNYDETSARHFLKMQKDNGLEDVTARLAVLNGSVEELEDWLVLSNAQKKLLAKIVTLQDEIVSTGDADIKKLIYKYGRNEALQAVVLHSARAGFDVDLVDIKDWKAPAFPLNGDDVIEKGIETGPEIGRVLQAAETWWLDNDMQPDRSACLSKLQEITELSS